MSRTIDNAARRHDLALINLWACVALGVPGVLVSAALLWLMLDVRSFVGAILAVVSIVLAVSIVGTAAGDARDAGARYRMTRDAGCLRMNGTWSRSSRR